VGRKKLIYGFKNLCEKSSFPIPKKNVKFKTYFITEDVFIIVDKFDLPIIPRLNPNEL